MKTFAIAAIAALAAGSPITASAGQLTQAERVQYMLAVDSDDSTTRNQAIAALKADRDGTYDAMSVSAKNADLTRSVILKFAAESDDSTTRNRALAALRGGDIAGSGVSASAKNPELAQYVIRKFAADSDDSTTRNQFK